MYYVGIIGAKSSLGKGVIAELEKHPSEFKVIFKVDDRYPEKNLLAGEFQSLEQVLSVNITPTFVLDFGIPEKVFERAKFYRTYEMPAIMQCVFGAEKCGILENIRGLSTNNHSPLIMVPDFSVIKTLMMKNLRAIAKCIAGDVDCIRIDVLYNTERYSNQNQWIYWAQTINHELGEHTGTYRMNGNTLTSGYVQYGFMRIGPLEKNEESITSRVLSLKNEIVFGCEMRYNLLDSRIKGVMKVLDWYCPQKAPLINAANNLYIDKLSDLI